MSVFVILFSALIVLSALFYAWFILRCYVGLRALPDLSRAVSAHRVTVIIPARNEELSIAGTLDSVLRQDHPADRLEIIVVDDASTDRTVSIVDDYCRRFPSITRISLPDDMLNRPSRKRGRKPEAIAAGIARSRYEVIVTTDADCISPPSWIRTITSLLNDDVVYAVGPVLEQQGTGLFTKFRALEVLGLVGITGGRISIDRPVNGHGGNTAFFRRVYDQTGRFDFTAIKSDEENMMHEIHLRRLGGISFAASPNATVRTMSPPYFASYWNQRMRWGSMHGRFQKKSILAELIVLAFSLFFPLAGLAVSFWIPVLFPAAAGALVLKAVVDFSMLRISGKRFGERFSVLVFVAGELVHGVLMIVIAIVAQIISYTWKDRTVLAVGSASK